MSGAQHTPGPWKADVMNDVNDDHGYLIACVHAGEASAGSPSGGDDIAEANARLIAAAPDLLEALKYARRFLKTEDHDTAYVDAAIAKAEGRS